MKLLQHQIKSSPSKYHFVIFARTTRLRKTKSLQPTPSFHSADHPLSYTQGERQKLHQETSPKEILYRPVMGHVNGSRNLDIALEQGIDCGNVAGLHAMFATPAGFQGSGRSARVIRMALELNQDNGLQV